MSAPAILDALSKDELLTVLSRVLTDHPALVEDVVVYARASVRVTDASTVADKLVEAVTGLDFYDLNGRAGDMGDFYVGPTEAAWELLNEAVAPFMVELKRLVATGLLPAAATYYEGVVTGVRRLRTSTGDVLSMAPDFAVETEELFATSWSLMRGDPHHTGA